MSTAIGRRRTMPDPEGPPVRVWRDWVLVAGVAGSTIIESAVRDDLVWRPVAVAFGLTLALTMLWRRTRPLAMVGLAFGTLVLVDLAAAIAVGEPVTLFAASALVVLVYALLRWGTGRQAMIGLALVLLEWTVSVTTDFTGVADAVGGLAVLLLFAALGVAIRFRGVVLAQQLDRVRLEERDTLARELHDTVAHHVSAIAIQAQAGQLLAESHDLAGTGETFRVIEQESSKALAEMRTIVRSLRRGSGTAVVARGVPDIAAMATAERSRGLRVEVVQSGRLDDLRPSVEAALYRVAQESITNAARHARQASVVRVAMVGETEAVRLSIDDDGELASTPMPAPGFGLVGMAERVALLGGTFEAGPGPDQGWTVRATIPRNADPA